MKIKTSVDNHNNLAYIPDLRVTKNMNLSQAYLYSPILDCGMLSIEQKVANDYLKLV